MLCPNIFLVKTFSFIHKIYIYIYIIFTQLKNLHGYVSVKLFMDLSIIANTKKPLKYIF